MRKRCSSPSSTLTHIKKTASALTHEITLALSAESRLGGSGIADAIARELVSNLVAVYMLSTTSTGLKDVVDKNARQDSAMQNFMYAKRAMEDSVAIGVRDGMAQFSGRPVEYCCQIQIVPPAINNEPC